MIDKFFMDSLSKNLTNYLDQITILDALQKKKTELDSCFFKDDSSIKSIENMIAEIEKENYQQLSKIHETLMRRSTAQSPLSGDCIQELKIQHDDSVKKINNVFGKSFDKERKRLVDFTSNAFQNTTAQIKIKDELAKHADNLSEEQISQVSSEIFRGFALRSSHLRLKKSEQLASNITYGEQGVAYIHLKGRRLGRGVSKQVNLAIKINTEYSAEKIAGCRLDADQLGAMEQENDRAREIQQKTGSPYVVQPGEVVVSYQGVKGKKIFSPQALMDSTLDKELKKKGKNSLKSNNLMILSLMRDYAKGIEAIHQCEYVHRDLKPDNLFLKRNEDHFIGVVGDLGELQSAKKCSGGSNRAYNLADPDVLDINTPIDLWPLGIILLTMCGFEWSMVPQRTDNESNALFQERVDFALSEMFSNSELAQKPQIRDLITQLLRVDPRERMTAKVLADSLENLLNSANKAELYDLLLANQSQAAAWELIGVKTCEDAIEILNLERENGSRIGQQLTTLDLTTIQDTDEQSLVKIIHSAPAITSIALTGQQSLLMHDQVPFYEMLMRNEEGKWNEFSIELPFQEEESDDKSELNLGGRSENQLRELAEAHEWDVNFQRSREKVVISFDKNGYWKKRESDVAATIQANQKTTNVMQPDRSSSSITFNRGFLLKQETYINSKSTSAVPRPDLFLQLTRDYVSGLQAIHQAGYVHGDINSKCLFISEGEEWDSWTGAIGGLGKSQKFVAEGGISTTVDDRFQPSHHTPEKVFNGKYMLSPATDVWALGVTLAEIFKIQLPEMNPEIDTLETYQLKLDELLNDKNFASSFALNVIVNSVIKKLLVANPEERISVEEFSTLLEELANNPEYCACVVDCMKLNISYAWQKLGVNSLMQVLEVMKLKTSDGSNFGEQFIELHLPPGEFNVDTLHEILKCCPNVKYVKVNCDASKILDVSVPTINLMEEFDNIKDVNILVEHNDPNSKPDPSAVSRVESNARANGWKMLEDSGFDNATRLIFRKS